MKLMGLMLGVDVEVDVGVDVEIMGLIPQEEAGEDTCWIEAQGRPLSHRPYNR